METRGRWSVAVLGATLRTGSRRTESGKGLWAAYVFIWQAICSLWLSRGCLPELDVGTPLGEEGGHGMLSVGPTGGVDGAGEDLASVLL